MFIIIIVKALSVVLILSVGEKEAPYLFFLFCFLASLLLFLSFNIQRLLLSSLSFFVKGDLGAIFIFPPSRSNNNNRIRKS